MKNIGRILLAATLTVVIIAVIVYAFTGPVQVDDGVVIEKGYIPAYTTKETFWDMMARDVLHDARWAIRVQDVDCSLMTEWWSVSESMYNYISVGDYVFLEGDAICVEGVEE